MLGEPLGGENHPAVLLRACVRALRTRRVDLGARAGDGVGGHVAGGRIGLGDERQHRRRVAQPRAVIGPGKPRVLLGRERDQRGGKDLAGAGAVAEHRQRRAELGLGERRRERVELGVGQIAQVADHRPAVARQHVERIGERGVVVGVRLGGVDDGVAQPVERLAERRPRRPRYFCSRARVRKSVTKASSQRSSSSLSAAHRPKAPLALWRLISRSIACLTRARQVRVEPEVFQRGEPVGVEERHRAADRLLRAAVRVAVERLQQRRRVERAERRGGDGDRARAGDEIGEEVARTPSRWRRSAEASRCGDRRRARRRRSRA